MNVITEEHIDQLIGQSELAFEKAGRKTVLCHATLPSTFEIVVSASCVDPSLFDFDIGVALCRERLKSKLWELEGYRLHLSR
jgi:hypothetical protein